MCSLLSQALQVHLRSLCAAAAAISTAGLSRRLERILPHLVHTWPWRREEMLVKSDDSVASAQKRGHFLIIHIKRTICFVRIISWGSTNQSQFKESVQKTNWRPHVGVGFLKVISAKVSELTKSRKTSFHLDLLQAVFFPVGTKEMCKLARDAKKIK